MPPAHSSIQRSSRRSSPGGVPAACRADRDPGTGNVLIVALSLILGLAVGYATGGRLANVQHAHFRGAWLVGAALALQLIAFSPAGAHLGATAVVSLHLLSYALLLVFAAANLRSLGVAIASLGIACNALVIAVNGGYMPARGAALASAGRLYAGAASENSRLMGSGTRLSFLGDVFAVPNGVPLANVFSIGDLLVGAGVAVLIVLAMHRHSAGMHAVKAV